MKGLKAIFKRELGSYFDTPVAYVFIVIFLVLNGIFTFYVGGFFERGQADLAPFFEFHPWLYMFLIPAVSMRLWSEERKSGTLELILTLPVSLTASVVGKFLAAWVFTALALLGTIPIWVTVNYLGDPDNTVIAISYIGSLLMAGGFLSIGSCVSALTKNQVIAFVVSFIICLAFNLSGFPMVLDVFNAWAPQFVVEVIGSFSFLTHFDSIQKGVIDIRDLIFFASLIGFWLFANVLAIEFNKGD
ncbi:MAG: ABC transporter permease subunit [Proteobacteria bacterium]|jgi:ABC-2 type transport system permease protein|nr:ABC transporter permease subunit [Pseudomonadota bacterium]MBT5065018.1 ABC transporter permease subunit [Pseudomonadota bacterium]MBT6192237.1 ABC transporter permease subunit [Pseudomonadota bacterium]MBT6465530.1 ABC transporter permease subunit [Pseudomonadota bacterium]MBT6673724.1 ABC transporter permease subunit [Pseudomonadota bacterium]|tara:strand:- start:3250 stop:3984 length:735 start_codon:yes stop_codon:yes gene_type:complete